MICKIKDCGRDAVANKMCMRCYKRVWREAHGIKKQVTSPDACTIEGCCSKGKIIKGLCIKHYGRLRRHGDPLKIITTERGTVVVEKIVFNGITFRRYPNAKQKPHRKYYKPNGKHIKNGVQSLHQEIWKKHNGPIPAGRQIHHKNENTADNRIKNLECVTFEKHNKAHSKSRSEFGKSPGQLKHLARIRPMAVAAKKLSSIQ